MDNEKEFISIIHKFIDSISSINQSLGSNKELLHSLLQKIDFQKEDNAKIEKLLKDLGEDLKRLESTSNQNSDLYTLFRAYLEKSIKEDSSDSSKEEIQLKIEQIRAEKEQSIEDKKQNAAVRSERWKTIAAIVTAAVTAVGVTFAAMKTEKDKKDETTKKEEVKKEEVKPSDKKKDAK